MSALVIEGGLVHYEYFGRGRPIIFLHGWLGSWRYWLSTMEELSDTNRCYALDMWGFGDSDKGYFSYTIQRYVDLLARFVDELGLFGPFPLVGHALGALIALQYANEYPGMVDRIMAVSLPLSFDMINRRLLEGTSGSLFGRVLGRTPFDGHEEVRREAERAANEAIVQSVESINSMDVRRLLESVRIPILLVYGANDGVIQPATESDFRHVEANLRLITMPQSRHFPMLDESNRFNRLLRDFLDAGADLSQLELKEEWQRRIR